MPLARHLLSTLLAMVPVMSFAGDDPLFTSHDTLAVRISAPLSAVQDNRDSGEYYDGTFSFADADGSEQSLDIKLRARGRYRRQERTCRFPPIRLNFRKKQVDGTLFDGQDKIKLVTHCRTGSERYEQLLLREFLAYRLMQALTDNSFSVRLLRITWVDTASANETFEHYGFLIEDEDRLGKRLGLEPAKVEWLPPSKHLGPEASLVALFEYMIGNTDFSQFAGPADGNCCHNVVPYESGEHYLAIPYDFDFAGLVDAPYAEPNPKLKLRNVRVRLYRGRCEYNEWLDQNLQHIRDRRATVLKLIDDQQGLDNRNRDSVRRYIDDFFQIIDNPKRVQWRLVRKCV